MKINRIPSFGSKLNFDPIDKFLIFLWKILTISNFDPYGIFLYKDYFLFIYIFSFQDELPVQMDLGQHAELAAPLPLPQMAALLPRPQLAAPLPPPQLAAPLLRPQLAAPLPRPRLTVLLPRAQVAAPLPRPQAASPLPRAQSVAPLHESPVHLPLMPPSSSSSPADLELIGNLQNQIALQQQLLQLQQQSQQLIGRALPTLGQTPPHPSPTSMSSASIVYSPESELATDLPLRDVNNLKIFLNWNFYGGGGEIIVVLF